MGKSIEKESKFYNLGNEDMIQKAQKEIIKGKNGKNQGVQSVLREINVLKGLNLAQTEVEAEEGEEMRIILNPKERRRILS
jgi:hypothetical protein